MSDDSMDEVSRGGRIAEVVSYPDDGLVDCPPTDEAHKPENAKVAAIESVRESHWGLFPANSEHLLNAAKAFTDAERFLKAAEFDITGFPLYIPTVNELRYYGYHINQAFACANAEDQREELRKAERHCRRAAFDAVELCLLSYMDYIQIFQNDYRKAVITEVLPEYPSMCDRAAEVRDFVESHSHEQRADYYEECLPLLGEVKGIVRKLEYSRSSLNAKRMQSIRGNLMWCGGFLLAVITAAAALIQANIIEFHGWQENDSIKKEAASSIVKSDKTEKVKVEE